MYNEKKMGGERMVQGFFGKKVFWKGLVFSCGLFLMILFLFLRLVDSEAGHEAYIGVAMGVAFCVVGAAAYLFNRKAFIHVSEDHISARHNWSAKLECHMDEVDFALAQMNMLTLRLKNGKRHIFLELDNAYAVAEAIRCRKVWRETRTPQEIREERLRLQGERKKDILWMVGLLVLMFAVIFLTLWLTGGRDIPEFSRQDKAVFAIMSGVELLVVVALFCCAGRAGKKLLLLEKETYLLARRLVETQPLPPGQAKAVYTDSACRGRIVVFRYPNTGCVSYTMEQWVEDERLQEVYDSGLLENRKALEELEEIGCLIDISKCFLDQ